MVHPLAPVLAAAAAGSYPDADGGIDVWAADADGTIAVVCFTGHAFVLADVERGEVATRATDDAGGGLGGAMAPELLTWLAGRDGTVGSTDVVLAAAGRARCHGARPPWAERVDAATHPRAQRALRHRRQVEVRTTDAGLITVGRGLVGRWELSVELFGSPVAGAGRTLVDAGLGLVPPDEWCFAQVAAGNARSLRAFLGAGFVPIGSEVLISRAAEQPVATAEGTGPTSEGE